MNKLAIDADIDVYLCFKDVYETIDTPFGQMRRQEVRSNWSYERRCQFIDDTILAYKDKLNADEYICYLTDPVRENLHRYAIADKIAYKENRKNKEKPEGFNDIVAYIMKYHNGVHQAGLEADDLVGKAGSKGYIMVSIDKDLRTCPGTLYNPMKNRILHIKDPGRVKRYRTSWRIEPTTEIVGTGFKWFCVQLLLGDTADNLPGIKGLGPAKIYTLIKDAKTTGQMWEVVYTQYKKHGMLDVLEEAADLTWIAREDNKTWRDVIDEKL